MLRALAIGLLLMGSCKIYGEPCQTRMAECLKGCDESGAQMESERPDDSRSACERDCHRCGPGAPAKAPAAGPPTPTGSQSPTAPP